MATVAEERADKIIAGTDIEHESPTYWVIVSAIRASYEDAARVVEESGWNEDKGILIDLAQAIRDRGLEPIPGQFPLPTPDQ